MKRRAAPISAPSSAQRELSGEIDARRRAVCAVDRVDQCELGGIGRAGQHQRPAGGRESIEQRGGRRRRPALEQPARSRDGPAGSAPRASPCASSSDARARLGFARPGRAPAPCPRPPARGRCGAARRGSSRRCGAACRAAADSDAGTHARHHQPASRARARRRSARRRGASATRRADARSGGRRDRSAARAAPATAAIRRAAAAAMPWRFRLRSIVCSMLNRRMAGEHRRRLAVDQRVDLGLRRRALQHREHRRGEQHVAVVAQLDHQRAANAGGIDRVGDGGGQHARGR